MRHSIRVRAAALLFGSACVMGGGQQNADILYFLSQYYEMEGLETYSEYLAGTATVARMAAEIMALTGVGAGAAVYLVSASILAGGSAA